MTTRTPRMHPGCRKRSAAFIVLIVLWGPCSSSAHAQQSPDSASWSAWRFLMGDWIGEGSGSPGQGSGGFTFSLDLQKTILVRRNTATYPATPDKPAYNHDDLMVIYYVKGMPEAVYFDNERHVIHYKIAFAGDSSAVVFLSDADASTPRYRLTYTKQGEDKVGITFEVAQPGKPGVFTRYIEAVARRK